MKVVGLYRCEACGAEHWGYVMISGEVMEADTVAEAQAKMSPGRHSPREWHRCRADAIARCELSKFGDSYGRVKNIGFRLEGE